MKIAKILIAAATVAAPLPEKTIAELRNGLVSTKVVRIFDHDTQVVCYVVPNQHCAGDCSYTPAISCLRWTP